LEFFNQYKDAKIKRSRYTKVDQEQEYESLDLDVDSLIISAEKIEEVKAVMIEVESNVLKWFSNHTMDADSYFDSEIINELDKLHSFISTYVENYPPYYTEIDGKIKINMQAFLDSRDILNNELGIDPQVILSMSSGVSGIYNDKKIHFDNGMTIDSVGNVFDASNSVIFSPTKPHQKVLYFDYINRKIVTTNYIRIDMPGNFMDDYFWNNDAIDVSFKNRLTEIDEAVAASGVGVSETPAGTNIIGSIRGVPLVGGDAILLRGSVENVYLGDIFGDSFVIDLIGQLKSQSIEAGAIDSCNMRSIPYSELNSLIFWGGGTKGVKPLSHTELTSADIRFKSDGTAYYTGDNATITTKRAGCSSKKYKTGHAMMWSSGNQVGIKSSLLQIFYNVFNTFGLFSANIPMLMGYKSFKVFPGICIGGLIEMAIFNFQEKMSKRINEMFQCVPTKNPSDAALSGIDGEAYHKGTSVDKLEDLDGLISVRTADKYVVNIVDTSVTKLNSPACGTFVFDPNGELSTLYPWRYKAWSGCPYSDNDPIIIDYSSRLQNDSVETALAEDNTYGTDGITKVIMALQYAFIKKQLLLEAEDVETSIDNSLESIVYSIMENCDINIGSYVKLMNYQSSNDEYLQGRTNAEFINLFYSYFGALEGTYKKPTISNYKRTSSYSVNSGKDDDSSYSVYVEYYDFSSLNSDVYLVPDKAYLSKYDKVLFSEKLLSLDQMTEVFYNNVEYLEKLGISSSDFSQIKTLRNYIELSDNKEAFLASIDLELNYMKYEMQYNELPTYAYTQCASRLWYAIDNKQL
jgi:hypothetical protein